jgi:hypothetical protein
VRQHVADQAFLQPSGAGLRDVADRGKLAWRPCSPASGPERGPQPAAKPALTTAAMALAPLSTRRRPGIDPWMVEANATCSSELLVSSLSAFTLLRAGKGTRLRKLRRVFPSSCWQHERQAGFVLS